MDYTIIVNDNGELKTISATEIINYGTNVEALNGEHGPTVDDRIESVINAILDARVRQEALS